MPVAEDEDTKTSPAAGYRVEALAKRKKCRPNQISLSVADLLAALFIVPLSLYSTLDPSWRFMGDNSLVFGYDEAFTICRSISYSIWLTSLLLCCPIVVAQMQVVFLEEAQLCVLDWSATSAYSMTLLVLVFLPTIVTVFNTGYKIIRAMRNPDQQQQRCEAQQTKTGKGGETFFLNDSTMNLEDSQRMVIETDPNFVLTMFLLVAFVLSWLPLLCLKVFEYFVPPQTDTDLSLAPAQSLEYRAVRKE
ncbi:hypothetical protein ANCCEY_11085 [Ancylostoma ceylanicum]|uniref:G-protein coupled receptors family 1 profile domain-containing protein n=1 Tax=Ancylostoma ceylanicum TaxID=53326 RepID=A0A0D6LCM6_9BILA|nr:hypothetical protein ANCCEY_11085 [Ancylostoma ceylanicum]